VSFAKLGDNVPLTQALSPEGRGEHNLLYVSLVPLEGLEGEGARSGATLGRAHEFSQALFLPLRAASSQGLERPSLFVTGASVELWASSWAISLMLSFC
jgi:hypothetical protein